MSRSCSECLSASHSACSVESNIAGNYLSCRINYYYMRLSKDQCRKGRFTCLTCSTLMDGLSDAQKRNTGRDKAEKDKDKLFFIGDVLYILRMTFICFCKLTLQIFFRPFRQQSVFQTMTVRIPRESQDRWGTTASGMQTICLHLVEITTPRKSFLPRQENRFSR